MLAPGRFVRAREITVWLSVPTLVAMMRRNGSLKPGVFPSMRLSLFCGEPLVSRSAPMRIGRARALSARATTFVMVPIVSSSSPAKALYVRLGVT